MSGIRLRRPNRSVVAGATAAALLALSGCAGYSITKDQPAQVEGPPIATTSAAPESGIAASAAPFALQFVAPTAAPCAQVWVQGATLPVTYEWCADESGSPVASARTGPCEVVVHNGTMYAVPGGQIRGSAGNVSLDAGYLDLLTSCKRRTAATRLR